MLTVIPLDTVMTQILAAFASVITLLSERITFTWGGFTVSMMDLLITALFLSLLFGVILPHGGEED